MLIFILSVAVFLPTESERCNQPRRQLRSPGVIQVEFFLSAECPITLRYLHTINNIVEKDDYREVMFIGYLMSTVKKPEVGEFKKDYNISDKLMLKTRNVRQARKRDAKVTPEVFVVVDSEVVYQGAIDNWYYGLGKARPVATEFFLIDALEAVLKGKQPGISKTQSVGCFIE